MTRRWLSSLVRARQVQEDLARERFAHAQRHANGTLAQTQVEDARVTSMLEGDLAGSAGAFLAAVSARQSAAATLAAAHQTHALAQDQAQLRRSTLTEAAQNRLSAEKLAERDATELRRAANATLQRELDEIGARGRYRSDEAQPA
jgi:flagellar biosynthesis chaperone FliJ